MTTVPAPTAGVTAVPVDVAAPDAQASAHDAATARKTVIAGIGGFATWCAPPGETSDTEDRDVGAVPIPVLAGASPHKRARRS